MSSPRASLSPHSHNGISQRSIEPCGRRIRGSHPANLHRERTEEGTTAGPVHIISAAVTG